ncbi:radical SAM protein [Candidatus Neomarinimicrobiota bacterium]
MALTSWNIGNREVIVSHKYDAITVSLTEQELVSYDLEGRYLGSYDHGSNIRRGLDNTFQLRWREKLAENTRLCHQLLSDEEARQHYENLRLRVAQIQEDPQAGRAFPETLAIIERATNTTYAQLDESAKEFSRLYGHIPILPPDQYRALVAQATDGCTYNQCSFCTLYRDKTFRVRSPEDFQAHIQDVLKFLGRGLSYRKSVFLGDANAIALATDKLEKLFAVLRDIPELQTIIEKGGIHAFLDIYTGARKEVSEYRILKDLGLQRVSLGVESGSENLLEFVNKPGSQNEILEVVHTLKEAGLAVVVILMVGLGGKTYQAEHLEHSVDLVKQLPMGRGDIIYLSQFMPKPGAPYLVEENQAGISPMSDMEIVVETQHWKSVLLKEMRAQGVKVSPYSFQRFLY